VDLGSTSIGPAEAAGIGQAVGFEQGQVAKSNTGQAGGLKFGQVAVLASRNGGR
jgi:hypothetical protein